MVGFIRIRLPHAGSGRLLRMGGSAWLKPADVFDMPVDDKAWPDGGSDRAQSPMVLDVRANHHALEFLV